MELRRALDSFYYSTALCDLRLMNRQFIDENITYNSLLYLELIYAMDGRLTASKIAEMLCVSKPAVTLKINELIRQGLVEPAYADSIIEKIAEMFSEEDIEKFCQMLNVLSDVNFSVLG